MELDGDGVGGGEGGGGGGAAVPLAAGAITDLQVVTRETAPRSCVVVDIVIVVCTVTHSCTCTNQSQQSLSARLGYHYYSPVTSVVILTEQHTDARNPGLL